MNVLRFTWGLGLGCFISGLWASPATAAADVRSPRKPVTLTYHGTKVTEDYRWLENANDPVVRKWSESQNERTRAFLGKLPDRPNIERRLKQLYAKASPDYFDLHARPGQVFALKFQPPKQQPLLVTLRSPNDAKTERVVLDPTVWDAQGRTAIDFYVPSLDGRLVAVSLSQNGSEDGTLHIYDVATGQPLADVIPRVQYPTGGGSVAWNGDGTGLYYTRYPHAGERPAEDLNFYQQVYFHKLGTPTAQDTYEIGREFPRIAEIDLQTREDGRYVLASVAHGDGGEFAHYLRAPSGRWQQITRFEDQIKHVEFGRDPLYIEWPKDDALYLLSCHQAPRGKILRLPLHRLILAEAKEVVKESATVIAGFQLSASGIYVEDMDGGPSHIRFVDFYVKPDEKKEASAKDDKADEAKVDLDDEGDDDKSQTKPDSEPDEKAEEKDDENKDEPADSPPSDRREGRRDRRNKKEDKREKKLLLRGIHSVQQMLCRRGDELLFRTVSFTEPFVWYTYDPNRDREKIYLTELRGISPVDFSDVEVVREKVKSKDGTKIPINIIRKKGTRLNGENPTLLTGYGGYGISLSPNFDFTRRVWLDQGGVIVVANLRGGGEYGEEWHKAGHLTHKQNVFDDFAACAEWLVRSNYTNPGKLAIEGGSNGGLLMGATFTQHPELCRAVVSHVGIYDMLRVELDANGQFNVTEYGSVEEPAQFNALYAYSPYHHVTNGTPYPSVLLLTGENDGRVNPAHSRKMTARLQAATSSRRPVLLRTSARSGHGLGTALDERIAQLADVYAFLLDQLGVEYSLVHRGPWSGAVTPTSAWVKAKLVDEGRSARLVLSSSPLLTRPVFAGLTLSSTARYDIVEFPLHGLRPDTQYYYALEVDGRLDRRKRGGFRTFPVGSANFSFAFASCGRTGSTNSVYDAIRANQPLFYMNVGDFHYENITNRDVGKFRAAYDKVLASPQQSDLYRHVPLVYIWDDHDFGGNNSNRKASSHEAARLVYDEYVPHYPLVCGEGDVPIYQTFAVGRVKFILTDLRSERDETKKKDDAEKSMMGAKQKEWFKQELLSANGKYPLIFWVSSVPWLGQAGTNYYANLKTNHTGFVHHTNRSLFVVRTNSSQTRTNRNRAIDEDHWSVYSTERREIADFIKSNHIRGLAILHGDAHMLGADDGSHSDFATGGGAPIPVMCGAPLDQSASLKAGPYSQGVYKAKPSEGCFGLVTVTDTGQEITVHFSGRNMNNEEKISLKFTFPAATNGARKKT